LTDLVLGLEVLLDHLHQLQGVVVMELGAGLEVPGDGSGVVRAPVVDAHPGGKQLSVHHIPFPRLRIGGQPPGNGLEVKGEL